MRLIEIHVRNYCDNEWIYFCQLINNCTIKSIFSIQLLFINLSYDNFLKIHIILFIWIRLLAFEFPNLCCSDVISTSISCQSNVFSFPRFCLCGVWIEYLMQLQDRLLHMLHLTLRISWRNKSARKPNMWTNILTKKFELFRFVWIT